MIVKVRGEDEVDSTTLEVVVPVKSYTSTLPDAEFMRPTANRHAATELDA